MTRQRRDAVGAIRLAAAAALSLGVLVAQPDVLHAKAQRVVHYTFDQVWPTAIRFLRVDEGFEIVERDSEAGYLLFDVNEENKRFRGALEIVRIEDDRGSPALRLILRIEDRPSYMEVGVLNRFERKLREQLGTPRERGPSTPRRTPNDKNDPDNKKNRDAESKSAIRYAPPSQTGRR